MRKCIALENHPTVVNPCIGIPYAYSLILCLMYKYKHDYGIPKYRVKEIHVSSKKLKRAIFITKKNTYNCFYSCKIF